MADTEETIDLIEEYLSGKVKFPQTRRLSYLLEKENGVDLIIDIINKRDTDDQRYNISEAAINSLGYRLVRIDRKTDALKIFKLNTEVYPDAFNTYDSYGEILMLTGDIENAIKAYEKSLTLNPHNENTKRVLLQLKDKG
jgi:tetratricopeptide (TPR) repeat protein